MRIIAGRWRSRTLHRPRTPATRPMPDRVKEAIFNILGSFYGCPGELPPFHVADVFAGSGSMGLEALSRGASACTFYERDRSAVEALRKNLRTLGAAACAEIVTRDAWRAAAADSEGNPFPLIFLDPPYRDSEDVSPAGLVRRYLSRVIPHAESTVLVLHHARKVTFVLASDDPWRIMDRREFGTNAVTFFERRSP